MYQNVCFLVLLFLNFGLILAETKADNVKDNCTAAEGDVQSKAKEENLCEDHHRNTCCQDQRRLICSCDDGFCFEGTVHFLKGVIGIIGGIISTFILILTWIFLFAQIIFSAAFSVVFLLFV